MGLGIPAFLEFDRIVFAGRIAALERHIGQLRNRRALVDAGEPAVAQDRGFERQLRRHADADLLLGRDRPGLVVEDHVAAVVVTFDAVGAHGELELALAQRNFNAALDFGVQRPDGFAPLLLPADEPAHDAQEARQPERARLRIVFERGEMLACRD